MPETADRQQGPRPPENLENRAKATTASSESAKPAAHRSGLWLRMRENGAVLTLIFGICSTVGAGTVALIWNLTSTLARKADIEDVATTREIESVNDEIVRLREAVERMSAGAEGLPALNERLNGFDADIERIETALGIERERVNDVQLFIGALQAREAARTTSSGGRE